MHQPLPKIAFQLGAAGLIPFIGFIFMLISGLMPAEQSQALFVQYSAIILSFLGGVHWYHGLSQEEAKSQLIVAMIPSILAWFCIGFMPNYFALWLLMFAHILLLIYDIIVLQPIKGYVVLRSLLVLIVSICHLLMIWLKVN